MNFFEIFQSFSSNLWIYGGTFILVLSLLVFVHEWGHYIIARLCGVKVESFSIGFGPELFGVNDKQGTRWKFSAIPLGGYVKLFGDTDPASAHYDDSVTGKSGKKRKMTKAEREQAFFAKPVWKRAAIVFAGPAINYIFAFLVLWGLFTLNGQPVTPPIAAAVIQGSSADQSGFKPHDVVLEIDGKTIKNFEEIRREMMIGLDDQKHFVVERDGKMIDIYAKPEKVEQEDRFGFKHSRGLLGLISTRQAIDIKSIAKVGSKSYGEDQTEAVVADLQRRMGTTFDIQVRRAEDGDVLRINPVGALNEHMSDPENELYGLLFVANTDKNVFMKYGVGESVVKAAQECWDVTAATLKALGQIVTGTRSASELGGIIRIGALAGDMAQQGIIALILFTALLSINLGLINLFPIPLLDGGHLLFYAFESMLGKPVPEHIQEYAFRFGLFFLVGVMVYTNLNDIMQLIL
ncbi:MAG: RIP metalloprotease RseP [Alphaproteobacteria bacterium]|nr:RIP metalloprotease RseP [Alphaproteobacteria bacterium]